MEVRDLLTDDDAVSPVIGVILMVAITVILAAVIATFVLGLGDQVSSTAPQASMGFDYNEQNDIGGELTITHDGGDSIRADELYLRGDNGTDKSDNVAQFNDAWADILDNGISDSEYDTDWSNSDTDRISGSASGEIGGSSAVTGGDYLELPVSTDGEIRVIYQASQGDSSATISTWSGPDA